MHAHDPLLTPAVIRKQVGQTLKQIAKSTAMKSHQLAAFLEVEEAMLPQVLDGRLEPSLHGLKNLAGYLGIDLENLLTGDLPEINLRQGGSHDSHECQLPQKYAQKNTHLALKRSMNGVINFVSSRHGVIFTSNLLMRLGISPKAYDDLGTFISPSIQIDYARELRKAGFPDATFQDMGESAANLLRQTTHDSELNDINDLTDLYDWLFEPSHLGTDRLFRYKVGVINSHKVELQISPKSDVVWEFVDKATNYVNRPFCQFKQGFFKEIPNLFGFTSQHLSEKECFFLGGKQCIYELSAHDA